MVELKNLIEKGAVSPQEILDPAAMTECVHMNWAVRRALAGREG